MMQPAEKTIVNAATSEGENVPEIQSLTLRVRDLNQSVDWWNTTMIWALVLVALAAIAVVVTTRIALTRAKQLADAQAELLDAKDREAAADSRNKELQIEEAKNASAGALEAAGSATLAAGKANERAAELENENLQLRQKLANRRITKGQHEVLVDFLSKRHGRIIIETMSDSESGLFAADILKTFTDAGWEIGGKYLPMGVIWTGLILYDSDDPDAVTVAQALKLAGIPFSTGSEKKEKATIMVGGKPPMF